MTKQIQREVLRMGGGIGLAGLVSFLLFWGVGGGFIRMGISTLLGCLTAWGYFGLLGMAVETPEKKGRYALLYLLRFGGIGAMTYWVLMDSRFCSWAGLIPLLFPRLLIFVRAWRKRI